MLVPTMSSNMSVNEQSEIAIAIMSPDQYWCQGLHYIAGACLRESIEVYFCRSLAELRKILTIHNISMLLTEEYGMGESLVDWLRFRQWLMIVVPKIQMVKLNHSAFAISDKMGMNSEVLNMAATISELRFLLHRVNLGMTHCRQISFDYPHLTERELYVLQCLCQAETPNKISKRLGLSTRTISGHKMAALRKLGLRNISKLLGGDPDLRRALIRYMSD